VRTLSVLADEGFTCTIVDDDDGRLHFTADADIDAHGASGQNSGPAAYKADDSGSELLANGGMKIVGARSSVCTHGHGETGKPEVLSELWPATAAQGFVLQPA